jgi:hypothetical protein
MIKIGIFFKEGKQTTGCNMEVWRRRRMQQS